MFKKCTAILFALVFVVGMIPAASASGLIASGTCGLDGSNLYWNLYSDGLLEIAGSGKMEDYETLYDLPWYNYLSSIKSVTVGEGVTLIGRAAFNSCTNLETVVLPEGLTSIGEAAFAGCSSLTCINLPEGLTFIDYGAFGHCSSLTSINLPEGLTSIGGRVFACCSSLTSVTIPEGVTRIEVCAFYECTGLSQVSLPDTLEYIGQEAFFQCHRLEQITLPENLGTIGIGAFDLCYGLKRIVFLGGKHVLYNRAFGRSSMQSVVVFLSDAPIFSGSDPFWGVTATVYYPEGNPTWTENIMLDYGGDLTWVAFEPGEGIPGMSPDASHCQLYELDTLDYLAFSNLAYAEALSTKPVGITVEQLLERSPDLAEDWGDIPGNAYKHADLFRNILPWRVHKVWEYDNGFLAVAFENDNGEAVLAYRGSENPMDIFNYMEGDWDAFDDWIVNDLPMELGNQVGTQFQDVIDVYDKLHRNFATQDIVTTGHSLGGAWGDVASAYSGCKAVTFNAVSALDAVYDQKPHVMSRSFDGVERWNIIDHINEHDILAGAFEEQFFTERIKPYIAYESLYGKDNFSDLANNHSLKSIVTASGEGNPCLTARYTSFESYARISHKLSHLGFGSTILDLGTGGSDTFHAGNDSLTPRTSYGGNSADQITTGVRADTLVGGGGGDVLDGSYQDDTYIYWKGDGRDTIHDISGDDSLWLYGFTENDEIKVSESKDDEYIWITCNSERIVGISKNNRDYWVGLLNSKSFKIYVDYGSGSLAEYDITEYFNKFKSGSRVLIGCPVHVEVLDPEGNVVYTLLDSETGNHYTEYGVFYVFEEENGEYGKILDLAEGYSARIVGAGEGIMDVTYQVPVDGELSEAVSVSGVYVTDALVANIEENEDGEIYLVVDEDGDGDTDTEHRLYGENRFTDVPLGSFYYDPVLWAVKENITSGATATTFNPNGECLRAQVVTFLWRAAGCPMPTAVENPFEDVTEGDYYYNAVLWAVEKGITAGVDATHFAPMQSCSRAQVVAFLYRAMGSPKVSAESSPFTDVVAGEWYELPVLWAVENGITAGLSADTFGVNTVCNRAQVVTFLYRTYVN